MPDLDPPDVTPIEAAATPREDRRAATTNSGQGWCTTLQQPAAVGVFGYVMTALLRKIRR